MKWFHKKIFNLTNDCFPNLDSKPHLFFSLSFKLLNHSLIIHPFQQTNTEGQAVDGDQDKELWICLIWCKFHSVVNSCQWLPICELLVFPQGKCSCVETPEISVTLLCQWLRFANEDCPWVIPIVICFHTSRAKFLQSSEAVTLVSLAINGR